MVARIPLAWKNLRGGTEVEWIGYMLDIGRFEMGVSLSRAAWAARWLTDKAAERSVRFDFWDFEDENHNKYKGELYALIVALTAGEAKCVVRGISEKNWEADGYLAIGMLQARYDANTAASLLQCVMEVVNPQGEHVDTRSVSPIRSRGT